MVTESINSSYFVISASYRKMVILTNEKLPWSPLAALTNQKDVSPKQELIYHSDWSPFTDHNMGDIFSSAKLFNIFQMPVEQVRFSSYFTYPFGQ